MYMARLRSTLPSRKLLTLCVILNVGVALVSFVAWMIAILGVYGKAYVHGTYGILVGLIIFSYLAILNLPAMTIAGRAPMVSVTPSRPRAVSNVDSSATLTIFTNGD
ncbi:hypothetical protein RvY_17266-2 [Ramazzottius varieornatus]|nr:hypothetical protein RvY_17266-2 [Ramazzottius varieornatus]